MSEKIDVPPLFLEAMRRCAERGGTRTNDGGMSDTLLSSLCSMPTADDPLVRWQMNPKSREDGYASLYTVTERGKAYLAEVDAG